MLDLIPLVYEAVTAPFSTPRGLAMLLLSGAGLALTAAATFARTMVPLRAFTVASQLAFVASAFFAPNVIAIAAYAVLIPLNAYRLAQIVGLTRRVRAAANANDLSGLWLKPYMQRRMFRAGEVVFRQGERADALYLLVQGELEFPEAGVRQPVGEMFGEIGFFSPGNTRTLSAECITDCEVMMIQEPTFRQLFYQSPEFAFRISNLVAARLSADVKRLQVRLEETIAAR